jgi:hypothetical protein
LSVFCPAPRCSPTRRIRFGVSAVSFIISVRAYRRHLAQAVLALS